MKMILDIYKIVAGDWRWTLYASNGRIVGASTEGYRNKADMLKNIYRVTGFRIRLRSRERHSKRIERVVIRRK